MPTWFLNSDNRTDLEITSQKWIQSFIGRLTEFFLLIALEANRGKMYNLFSSCGIYVYFPFVERKTLHTHSSPLNMETNNMSTFARRPRLSVWEKMNIEFVRRCRQYRRRRRRCHLRCGEILHTFHSTMSHQYEKWIDRNETERKYWENNSKCDGCVPLFLQFDTDLNINFSPTFMKRINWMRIIGSLWHFDLSQTTTLYFEVENMNRKKKFKIFQQKIRFYRTSLFTHKQIPFSLKILFCLNFEKKTDEQEPEHDCSSPAT